MDRAKLGRWAARTPVVALLVAATWLRLCALGALPEPNADEAFFGLQAAKLVSGGRVAFFTASGNFPDLFYTAMLAPLVAAFGATFWVLRLPAVVSSVLSVAVAYLIGRRVLGRPAAVLASLALAVLPASVLCGGIGLELTQSPLFGLVAIFSAFRARLVPLALAFAAGLVVHPTNVFLLPVVAPVYVASAWALRPDARSRRRLVVLAAAASAAVVVAAGCYALGRPASHRVLLGAIREPRDWAKFLGSFARLIAGVSLYGVEPAPSPGFIALRLAIFWGLAAGSALGLARLVADRRWDRAALVAGVALALLGLHLVAGPSVLLPPTARYGYVLIAPTVLAFGVTFAPLLARGSPAAAPRPRRVVAIPLLALAWLPLADVKSWALDLHAFYGGGRSLAFWSARGFAGRTYASLLDDIRRPEVGPAPIAPRVIIAQDFWLQKPLEYLAAGEKNLRVVAFHGASPEPAAATARLVSVLEAGGYAAAFHDQDLDRAVRAHFPPGRLRRIEVKYARTTFVDLYRLGSPGKAVATSAGRGTAPANPSP